MILQIIETKGGLLNSFYKAKIAPMPKPGKDTREKENNRTVNPMNTDTE